MPQLFVDQSVEINAPAAAVWDVLTAPDYTRQWINTGWQPFLKEPAGPLNSDWALGSEVQWPYESGEVYVTGNVTAVEPNHLLRFTVFDTTAKQPSGMSDNDGITFILTERDRKTRLAVRQGDFGKMEGGEKYHRMTEEVWQRVLPKVKELAEAAAAQTHSAS